MNTLKENVGKLFEVQSAGKLVLGLGAEKDVYNSFILESIAESQDGKVKVLRKNDNEFWIVVKGKVNEEGKEFFMGTNYRNIIDFLKRDTVRKEIGEDLVMKVISKIQEVAIHNANKYFNDILEMLKNEKGKMNDVLDKFVGGVVWSIISLVDDPNKFITKLMMKIRNLYEVYPLEVLTWRAGEKKGIIRIDIAPFALAIYIYEEKNFEFIRIGNILYEGEESIYKDLVDFLAERYNIKKEKIEIYVWFVKGRVHPPVSFFK